MKTIIQNELTLAGINYNRSEYGNLVQIIEDAISTVQNVGLDYWINETTMGQKLINIVLKLYK